jgi:hypothetical protein
LYDRQAYTWRDDFEGTGDHQRQYRHLAAIALQCPHPHTAESTIHHLAAQLLKPTQKAMPTHAVVMMQ